jgi:hypothetical protein
VGARQVLELESRVHVHQIDDLRARLAQTIAGLDEVQVRLLLRRAGVNQV